VSQFAIDAQFILDFYPDFVSEFGLLGCLFFTITCASAFACLVGIAHELLLLAFGKRSA
jgi:hypothetical protein